MKVLSVPNVSPEQIQADYPKLKEIHAKAMKSDPLWEFFGGVLSIDGREYQVCNNPEDFV